MKKLNEYGVTSGLLIPFVLVVILLLIVTGFAVWAFGGRQDYKNNVNQKITIAVDAAKKQVSAQKDAEFAQEDKIPSKTYTGPSTYGSVGITYPKTWSAYVDENTKNSIPLDAYFNPNFVPGLTSGTSVALRVQITSNSYTQELKLFDSPTQTGAVKVSPFSPPKVSGVVGVRVDGAIASKKVGSLVLLPLRDKTLKVWTESDQYTSDFNQTVLGNLTFVP